MTNDKNIRFLDVGALKIRIFTKHLESKKVPLLILNGLGQSIEILFPLINEFDERPIIVFDMPGIGLSEMPDGQLSIPEYARLTSDVLASLEVEDFDVMGISWGGSVAQQMARDHVGRCRKLILAITAAGGAVSWWGSPIAVSEIMFPFRFANKTYGNFVGPLMYGGDALTKPDLFREYSRKARRPTQRGYFSQVRALCNWTSVHWLGKLRQPTLVVAGAYDALIPFPNQLFLARTIPGAELKIFNDGHLLLYSRRREVGRLLAEFLDRNPAEKPDGKRDVHGLNLA